MAQTTVPTILGVPGTAKLVTVRQHCKHQHRWHLFAPTRARLRELVGILEGVPCPRCVGDVPGGGPCDAIYHPTGVAHLHTGPCPDAAPDAQRWLHGMKARIF